MGKFITELFADQIISMIESKKTFSYMPEGFKHNWFERVAFEKEFKKENCYLDADGFWISKEKRQHGSHRNVMCSEKFWWRIEPNYCTAGRPFYSDEKRDEIYAKSETKKYILKMEKTHVCLEWDGFDSPTDTCWGLRMKPVYMTVYENGKKIYSGLPIFDRKYKRHFKEWFMEYYQFIKK